MGFLNFEKPGRGIDPNAPKKKGIFLYSEVLFGNFWDFIKTNLLYFAVSLPMIIISLWAGAYFTAWFSNRFGVADPMLKQKIMAMLAFLFFAFIGSGPASAALAYFFRAKLREEHIYIMSGFFQNMKKNFRQGIIVGIINPVVIFAALFSTFFYGLQYLATGSLMWFGAMLVVGMVGLIFTVSCTYIYQLMITFENSIFELYKNALLLALMKAPQTLGVMLIIAIITYFLSLVLTPVATLFFAVLGTVIIARFALDFYAVRVIEKNILKK